MCTVRRASWVRNENFPKGRAGEGGGLKGDRGGRRSYRGSRLRNGSEGPPIAEGDCLRRGVRSPRGGRG